MSGAASPKIFLPGGGSSDDARRVGTLTGQRLRIEKDPTGPAPLPVWLWEGGGYILRDGSAVKETGQNTASDLLADDARLYLAIHAGEWLGGGGPEYKQQVVVTSAQPNYAVSGSDSGRRIRIAQAGYLDCRHLPRNLGWVDVDSTATCLLDCGPGNTWRTFGSRYIQTVAGSMLRLFRGQADYMAQLLLGSAPTVPGSPVVPTASIPFGWFGQSYAERPAGNGGWGFQTVRSALNLPPFYVSNNAFCFGAASMTDIGSGVNFFWNQNTNSPGPNLTAGLAALTAFESDNPTAAPVNDLVCLLGANDWPVFNKTGPVTFEILRDSYLSAFAHVRTALSRPGLRIWICPMGGIDEPNASGIPAGKAYAQRLAQLEVTKLQSNTFRGPPWYDLPFAMRDRIHPGINAQAIQAARLALFHARRTGASPVWCGPRITSFFRTEPGRWRVNIAWGGGYVPPVGGFGFRQKPARPLGFAVLPDGDIWSNTPRPIRGYSWTSDDNLDIFLDEDGPNDVGVYPYGHLPERSNNLSRVVRATHNNSTLRETLVYMPLMEYLPEEGTN